MMISTVWCHGLDRGGPDTVKSCANSEGIREKNCYLAVEIDVWKKEN